METSLRYRMSPNRAVLRGLRIQRIDGPIARGQSSLEHAGETRVSIVTKPVPALKSNHK